MISGILITAKCHMHVSQLWDLYTEIENKHVKHLSGCQNKMRKITWQDKIDVLLLN